MYLESLSFYVIRQWSILNEALTSDLCSPLGAPAGAISRLVAGNPSFQKDPEEEHEPVSSFFVAKVAHFFEDQGKCG